MLKQHCLWQMLQKGVRNLTRSYADTLMEMYEPSDGDGVTIILALSHILLMIALAWQIVCHEMPPCSLRHSCQWYESPVPETASKIALVMA